MPILRRSIVLSAVLALAGSIGCVSVLLSDSRQKRDVKDARDHSRSTKGTSTSQKENRYNILFLVSDDMNDWIGSLGGIVMPSPLIWIAWPSDQLFSIKHIVQHPSATHLVPAL